MKYQQSAAVVALLLGTSRATQRAPQSVSLFATGMNGDEDLAEDITMKGDKFHYLQKDVNTPASASKVAVKADPPKEAPKEEKKEEKKDAAPAKEEKKEEKKEEAKADAKPAAPAEEKKEAAPAKEEAKAEAPEPEAAAPATSCNPGEIASVDGNCYFEGEALQVRADPPEKVLTMDPKIARHATSFYGQTASTSYVQVADEGTGKHETEKTHVLEPIPSHIASFEGFPNQRTAFYAQLEDEPAKKAYEGHFQSTDPKYVRKYDTKGYGPNGAAEKVSVPDARITHTHTTFYDKKNRLWREDQAALIGWQADVHSYNGDPAEKVNTLEPAQYAWHANTNSLDGTPIMRSTYYGQIYNNNMEDEEPEKVHTLEPEAYQDRANSNKPNPRTTFYPQAVGNSFASVQDGKHETEKTHPLEPEAAHEWAEYNWGIHKGGRGDMTTWY